MIRVVDIDQEYIQEASKSMPVFNLVPNTSINGLKLISPRTEVRKKFGSPLKSGTLRYSNGDICYYDVFNGITVIYNHRYFSEQFQIYGGEARINRFKIYPGTVKEFVKCFPDTYQCPDGWISRDYSMAIKETDGIITDLIVAYEGFYDKWWES